MLRINQVEITNRCNLSCGYCPHSNSKRQPIDMSYEIFRRTISYIKETKEKLLTLHNFGEPLLHPELENFIALARDFGLFPGFSTNGLLLTEQRFENLTKAGLRWMCITIHKKECLDIYRRLFPLASQYNVVYWAREFADQPLGVRIEGRKRIKKHDFAGTAPSILLRKSKKNKDVRYCDFIKHNFACVLADGTITACCFDERGVNKRGHINNIAEVTHQSAYPLCKHCEGLKLLNKWQRKIIDLIYLYPYMINLPIFRQMVFRFL